MRHGKGVLTYNNGSIYEGDWERGMKWGQGKMTYASGNYYEGAWSNNKRNGYGCMHWLTSEERYEGNWEDNFQSGFGAHIWLDGSTENKLLRNRYVGYWLLGQRHGKGAFYYSNGSKYEGDWKENFKHGIGCFTFEDGTKYEGPFDNDSMVKRVVAVQSNVDLMSKTGDVSPKKEPKKPDQTPAAKTDAKDKDKKSNASGVKAKEPAKAAPVVSASPTKA